MPAGPKLHPKSPYGSSALLVSPLGDALQNAGKLGVHHLPTSWTIGDWGPRMEWQKAVPLRRLGFAFRGSSSNFALGLETVE